MNTNQIPRNSDELLASNKLDDCLQVVASRSFYEDTAIYWSEARGEYVAEDVYARVDNAACWDSVQGIYFYQFPKEPGIQYGSSGIMETYEFFDNPKQIRRYCPEAVQAIEASEYVEFAYIAMDIMEEGELDSWTLAYSIEPTAR